MSVLEFLLEEKKSVLEKIKEYAEQGNTYSIATSNEKLKNLNILIAQAEGLSEEPIQAEDLPY